MANVRTNQIITELIGQGGEQAARDFNAYGKGIEQTGKYAAQAKKSLQLFTASLVTHRIGQALENMGRKMLDFATSSFNAATKWEHGMRLVRTQTDLTAKGFQRINDRTLQIASKMPFAFDEVSQSLYDIYSGTKLVGIQGTALLQKVARAAVAGGSSIDTATQAVIGAINSFNIGNQGVNHLLDLQFQLVRKGRGDYEDFALALNNVYPSAARFGQTLEDTFGAVAFMSKRAASPAQAIISVARAMDQLGRSTNAENLMNTLGVSVYDTTGKVRSMIDILKDMHGALDGLSEQDRAKALYEIFGRGSIQANRFLNLAIPGIKELQTNVDYFGKDAQGQFEKAFGIMKGDPATQLAMLSNHFEALRIKLASKFFPAFEKGLSYIDRLISAFERLPAPIQDTTAKMVLLGGVFMLAAGKFLTFASSIMGMQSLLILSGTKIGDIGKVVRSSLAPFTAMALKIGLVIGAIALLMANWEKVARFGRQHALLFALAVGVLATAIGAKLVPALVTQARLLYYSAKGYVVLAAAQVSAAISTKGFMGALMGFNIWLVAIAAAITAVVAVYKAWKAAQEAQARNVESQKTLNQAWLDQIKLGTRTAEENLPKIKGVLDDETLSWDERNEVVRSTLASYNDWVRAGGKVVKSGQATYASVHRQIVVNQQLGQKTEWLEKKIRVFAGMTMEETDKWAASVAESATFVEKAFGDVGEEGTITGEKIVRSFRRQLKSITNFEKNLATLVKRGLPEELGQKLVDMGPQGAIWAAALVKSGKDVQAEFARVFDDVSAKNEGLAGFLISLYSKVGDKAADTFAGKVPASLDKAMTHGRDLLAVFGLIPRIKTTTFTVNTDAARAAIASFIYNITHNPIVMTIKTFFTGSTTPPKPSEKPKLHSGGLVAGPKGREVDAVLRTREFVINEHAAARFTPLLDAINKGYLTDTSGGGGSTDPRRRISHRVLNDLEDAYRPRARLDFFNKAGESHHSTPGVLHINLAEIRRDLDPSYLRKYLTYLISHEYGHQFGFKNDVNNRWSGLRHAIQGEFPNFSWSNKALINRLVGQYATQNKQEFIADTFAFWWAKKKGYQQMDMELRPWGGNTIMPDVPDPTMLRVVSKWIGRHYAMARGGTINEPIFGVGQSGNTYSFGEGGKREHVVPDDAVVGDTYHIQVTNDQDGRKIARELDWRARQKAFGRF